MAASKEPITGLEENLRDQAVHDENRLIPSRKDEAKKDLPPNSDMSSGTAIESSSAPESDKERIKMQALVASFSESQLNRYEMYRRASFPKAAIRRLMQSVMTGGSVPPNVVIAMAGIAKVYIGEICEEALDIMEERKDHGPIQPKHLREAVRRLKRKSLIPNSRLIGVE